MTAAPTVNVPEVAWRLIVLPAVCVRDRAGSRQRPGIVTYCVDSAPRFYANASVTVKGAAVFASTAPVAAGSNSCSVALETAHQVFAPFKVVPVAETAVNNPRRTQRTAAYKPRRCRVA